MKEYHKKPNAGTGIMVNGGESNIPRAEGAPHGLSPHKAGRAVQAVSSMVRRRTKGKRVVRKS